jgi:ABC-type branched-subunit amino acid transport system substrate-binding protein
MISFRFINFYEGFLLAVDSMNDAGMKLNLFVYDVDNTEEKINRVLHASELSRMDLIIGPLFSEAFKKLADFAKIYEINIINPLSAREEVIFGNPNVFKIKPSSSSQIDKLTLFIQDHFPESNVVIVRHNKYKYQADVSYIRNYLNSNRNPNLYIHNRHIVDLIKSQDYMDQMLTENMFFDLESLKDRQDDSTLIPC